MLNDFEIATIKKQLNVYKIIPVETPWIGDYCEVYLNKDSEDYVGVVGYTMEGMIRSIKKEIIDNKKINGN